MINIYEKVLKVWKDIAPEEAKVTFSQEIDLQNKIIKFFQPGPTYYFIFNVNKGEFEFISNEIKEILGYENDEISAYEFLNKIHPDDQPYFITFEEKLNRFFRTLTFEQIPKYKVQYTFRVQNKKGKYLTMLHQLIIIQFDDKNLIRSLGIHSDISHLNLKYKPSLSFIGMEGEPSYYNVPIDDVVLLPAKELFTLREKELIRLIVEGNNSIKISELLFISVHTVETHRKNILKKTDCKNWIEISGKAIKNCWI
jgi:DNA-binding CsgD family transcriptional regulator